MEIRHLKLIKEVARTGSLTKAKDSLYLSQSALSHQLREIESQLGTPVFHRVNKQLDITNAGQMMLEGAERILAELENTEASIKKYISGDTGTIKLATECHTCYHWLPSLLIDYKKEFPNVEVDVLIDNSCDMEQEVTKGKIDLAVITDATDRPELSYYELFKDEMVALVNADHPWVGRAYVEAQDFEDQHVLIHSYPLESVTLFSQLLIPEKVSPKKISQVQVDEAMVQLVKAGMGVRVIAKWIIEPYLKDPQLAIIPVTKKGMYRRWFATTLKQETPPQYLENFKCHLKNNIRGLCD